MMGSWNGRLIADWPLQGGDMETESKDPTVLWVDDWDEGAPWLPWASHSDPLGMHSPPILHPDFPSSLSSPLCLCL